LGRSSLSREDRGEIVFGERQSRLTSLSTFSISIDTTVYFDAALFETHDLAGQETDPYPGDPDILGKHGKRSLAAHASVRWNDM
jgi:hypothetical protein